jgi:hypothetical protein
MFLTKGGVTIEVFHPSDIARYKKVGYVQEKALDADVQEDPKEPKAPKGKGKSKEGKE